jgi:RNA polymerase sigma-70 factor (ECF subfamily)
MRLTKEQRDDLLELFTRVSPDLARYAWTLRRPVGCEPDDLVQITFQEAARAWHTLGQRPPEDRRKWLYTVLRNKAVDEWRKTRRVDPTPDDPRPGLPPDPAEVAEQSLALARCWAHIGGMSAKRQQIAFLAWQMEWRTPEIAAYLGIAQSTVRGHLHVVRQRLRADLGHLMTATENETDDETTGDADES